ncbi:MAG: TetR/AcrR family transcriptional regulator [Rhizobiaceae bacterium]|nr:TetR/AcrR family transcriptional regulator [Rhizobiaceae bacterium]MCV0405496.1 TetR/AcrR family transcriptional regulator [Rhizobiaceae bacterium]
MRDDMKAARQERIEEAAYRLVRSRGYSGVSMLAIAREARASNETLYRWYGDKRGLFKAMVETNARRTPAALDRAISEGADPLTTLSEVGPVLLAMLLGERAVLLNRAAAADETGELGETIAAGGREAVFPMIEALMGKGMEAGTLAAPSAGAAAEWFLALLIGDQQIRRVIGAMPEPSPADIETRAAAAMTAFRRLCAA